MPTLASKGYFEPTCLKLSPKEAEHSDLLPGKSLAVSANFMVKGIKDKDKGSFTFEF